MKQNPQRTQYHAADTFSSLIADTHGILRLSDDGEYVTLTINDVSSNGNISPVINYSVSTKDTLSGVVAHKTAVFPPNDADYQRGNGLSYRTKIDDNNELLRLHGQVINERTQELMFTFLANSLRGGWHIIVDDYIDHK